MSPSILLVDDHELLRKGVRQALLAGIPRATFAEASTVEQAEQILAARWFHLTVLDLNLAGRSGLDLLAAGQRARPPQRILVLSVSPEEELALQCLRLGAAGYVTKGSAASELLVAARRILEGGRYVSPALAERLAEDLGTVTPVDPRELLSGRELEVLRYVARGLTLREIGDRLGLSEKTVATYRRRISDKLALGRVADLTRYALRHGLVD